MPHPFDHSAKKTFRKSLSGPALLMAVALLCGGCTVNPATGEQQFTALMSPAQEAQIGAEEHQNVIKQFGAYEDRALQDYINQVGQSLARFTERNDVKYRFTLLDTPIPNAFALPGGYVYITRGILALANDESEMAAVLAHEIGHITARHSAERYSQAVVTNLGLSLADALLGPKIPHFGQAASIGGDLFLKSFSRSQENQADTLGIRYLSRAGYDPYGMTRFLENLQRQKNYDSLINGQGQSIPTFLSTHPGTEDRIVSTAQQNRAQFPPNGNYRRARDMYLAKVTGMVYDDGADQGYVRGNSFIHTKLGFRFDIPNGFSVDNQPAQVVATDRNGAAIVFDGVKPDNSGDPFIYLTQVWGANAPLQRAERLTINGMPAATAAMNNQGKDIRLLAIKFSPRQYFRFAFITPDQQTRRYDLPFRETTYSFRALKPGESRKYNPKRIVVVKVGTGDTVRSLAARMDVPKNQESLFRTLNAMGPNDQVKAGDQVKLVLTP